MKKQIDTEKEEEGRYTNTKKQRKGDNRKLTEREREREREREKGIGLSAVIRGRY